MRRTSSALPVAVVGFFIVAAVVVGLYVFLPQSRNIVHRNTNIVACPRDAKICPDGSTVGRLAPSCDFATCPIGNINQNTNTAANTNSISLGDWRLYENSKLLFSVKLPPTWEVDTSRSSVDEIVFTDGTGAANREAVKSTVTSQTVGEWATLYQGEDGYRVTDYTLDGQAGKRVRYNGIDADYIAIKNHGRLYVVTVGRMETNGMLATIDVTP